MQWGLSHTDTLPTSRGSTLITSVDAALAGQNTLLAASLGYGGVIIGLVRYKSVEVANCLLLNYNLPSFWDCTGVPNQKHDQTKIATRECCF